MYEPDYTKILTHIKNVLRVTKHAGLINEDNKKDVQYELRNLADKWIDHTYRQQLKDRR